MPKHIALFGGSFDPPHLGHLALAKAALTELNIDELWLMPVGIPVHKKLSGKASAEQRLSWLQQMFAGEKRIKIMDWEISREKATPAVDTLKHFKSIHPDLTPTWLMGMDSFLDLPNWVDYPLHLDLCNLAVFQRKDCKKRMITNGWKTISPRDYQQNPPIKPGHVVYLDTNLPHISATAIRQNIGASQHLLAQSNCNAILACYASDLMNQEREDT